MKKSVNLRNGPQRAFEATVRYVVKRLGLERFDYKIQDEEAQKVLYLSFPSDQGVSPAMIRDVCLNARNWLSRFVDGSQVELKMLEEEGKLIARYAIGEGVESWDTRRSRLLDEEGVSGFLRVEYRNLWEELSKAKRNFQGPRLEERSRFIIESEKYRHLDKSIVEKIERLLSGGLSMH